MKVKLYFLSLLLASFLGLALTSPIEAQSLPSPWLLAPNFNPLLNTNPVVLTWQLTLGNIALPAGDTYHLQVSTNSNFSTLALDAAGLTIGSDSGFIASPSTTYHWRVRLESATDSSSWSGGWFATVSSLPIVNADTIVASSNPNGTISPSGNIYVINGGKQTFTFTPNIGYQFAGLLVDGISVDSASSYTFTNVASNHTIAVSYSALPLPFDTIFAYSDNNGSISPLDTIIVANGSDTTFTFTPNAGYHLASVLVDGMPVDSLSTYTFHNISASHTISVSFMSGTISSPTITFGTVSSVTGGIVSEPVYLSLSSQEQYVIIQGKAYYDSTKLKFDFFDAGTGTLFNTKNWFYYYTDSASSGTQRFISFIAAGYTPIASNGILFNLGFTIIDLPTDSASITGNSSDWIGFTSNVGQTNFTVQSGMIHYIHVLSASNLRGDANMDGAVTIADAQVVMNDLMTPFLSGQDSINADANQNNLIDIGDVHTIEYYVLNGTWPSPPIYTATVQGALKFRNVNYTDDNLISLPVNIENGESINSLQIELVYDPAKIKFNNFVQQVSIMGNLVSAKEVSPGKAIFAFASANNFNGNINPGKIFLKFANGIPAEGTTVQTYYNINHENNGQFVSGPQINFSVTGVDIKNNSTTSALPKNFELSQNYPNPFNPSTQISYSIPKSSLVSIKVYNMLGQQVRTLVEDQKNAGTYNIQWNGDNDAGVKVSSGTYIYRIVTGSFVQAKKMILLK